MFKRNATTVSDTSKSQCVLHRLILLSFLSHVNNTERHELQDITCVLGVLGCNILNMICFGILLYDSKEIRNRRT